MEDPSDASSQVLQCISSPLAYTENAELIFENLGNKSKTYTDNVLKTLAQVFPSSDYTPVNKFYALYFLAKASETKNEFFAGRIIKQRPLLDKLFKDCQYDGAKPMSERGKNFFSKTPNSEEIILGGNYVRLLLELFAYWNRIFGTEDTQNPLHAYKVMFDTLAQKIIFPENLLYITKNYTITDDFHMMPPPSLPSLEVLRSRSSSPTISRKELSPELKKSVKKSQPTSPEPVNNKAISQINSMSPTNPASNSNSNTKPVNSTTSPTTNQTTIAQTKPVQNTQSTMDEVRACIPSGRDYKLNSGKVFDRIKNTPKEYTSGYVKVTTEILKSKEVTPAMKFYAVYLLTRLSETKNQILITGIATNQDLLNELFLHAQMDRSKENKERGKKIFSANPTADEAKIGHNYLVLLTEALIYWKRNFTSDNKKDPTSVFNVIYSTLETKTKIPQTFYYVGRNLDTDGDHLPTKFELIPAEELPNIGGKSSSKTSSPTKITSEPTQKTTAVATGDASLAKIQEGLNKLDGEKASLREVLDNNTEENDMKELLDYLFKDVYNTYNTSISPHVEPLLSGTVPNSEKYVTQVFQEGETVEQLSSHYNNYKKGKIPYRELRARALPLLKPQEDTYGTSSGVTPGNDLERVTEKNFKEEAKEEAKEEIYRETSEQQERDKKAAVPQINTLKADNSQKLIHENSPAFKQIETQANKPPRNVVVGSSSNPVSERTKEKVETGVISRSHRMEEIEVGEPLQDNRAIKNLKSPNNIEAVSSDPRQKKQGLESHIYKFKSAGVIEDDSEAKHEGGSEVPTKQNQVQTLEDEHVNNNEPREVRSIHNPSPFRKYDDLESVEDKSLKASTLKSYSLRMTPSRKTENDEDLSKSMKLSRVKPQDLSVIESSIRQSFMSTGKRPPQFKPLNELTIKEEYEREIQKLKAEKEALVNENNRISTQLKEFEQNPNQEAKDKVENNQLKQLIDQHQQKIEALQEDIVALSQENRKLKKKNELWEQFKPASGGEEENLKHLRDKMALEERIIELEKELALYQVSGKPIAHAKVSNVRAGRNVAPKIETANLGNADGTLRYSTKSNEQSLQFKTSNDDWTREEKIVNAGYQEKYFSAPNQAYKSSKPNENEENERFQTPIESSVTGQTPYDVDWANNTHPVGSVESSAYDVEWPASAYKEKGLLVADSDLTKAIEAGARKTADANKDIRGRLIETTNSIFVNLKSQIRGLPWTNDMRTFKIACLKGKCPLFENDNIRVGVSSTVVHDNTNHKNMLKLVLYFENKGELLIDNFETEVIDAKGLNRIAKPNKLETPIEKGKQVKQQIVVTFDRIPFECLQLLVNVRTAETNFESFNLYLPTLITKFMEFKYVTAEVFREKWKIKNVNVLKTEEITMDTNVVKTAYDFKKYFGYLIDLKPMDEYDFVQGTKSIKLGGVFELDIPNAEYLLKINVLPTHQVVFQIATFDADNHIGKFILQALAFLFKRS